jgi:predicted secreted protein
MTALAGRKSLVKVCTTSGGSFVNVKGIKQITFSRDGALIDVSEFGDDWKRSLRGILDATFDLQGNYEPSDTTGQGVLETAFMAGTDVFIQYLPDGTAGWQMQATITKFSADSGVDKEVSLQVSGNQTGGITII